MKKNKIVRWFFNRLYKFKLPEMVQYWKTGDNARAKLVILADGAYAMVIEGEKYPLYGFPRGPVLFGPVARLKYLVKNLIFNQIWELLEEKKTNEEIMSYVKNAAIPEILKEIEKNKYDMFPYERMCPFAKELWRTLTEVEKQIPGDIARQQFEILKKGITFFLQEDDAYRFRVQWVAKFINPKAWWRKIWYFGKVYSFEKELGAVLNFLENSEIVIDMKLRIKLIKRILFVFLEDKEFGELINKVIKELNWKKLYLSKSDRYFFRGKYFKVDNDKFDY